MIARLMNFFDPLAMRITFLEQIEAISKPNNGQETINDRKSS